jgi:pimeloyl-ACP methyl ester carboxylesterase
MRKAGFLSILFVLVLLAIAVIAEAQETSMVHVTVDGQNVRLAMLIYKPSVEGKVPTLVFNHGSTGTGRDPNLFTKPQQFSQLAQFFVQHGWAVVMPSRRGRGDSEGEYDEGFAINRSRGYTCDPSLSLPGVDRALRDIEAAMRAISTMPFIDSNRVVIGGASRGGILSIAYAGQHPEQVKGVINFVGGWLGYGCETVSTVNQEIFKRGGRYPGDTLWLYGDWDQFYPLFHSRENFAAFQAAGGKGVFHEFAPPPGLGGHRIVERPDLWGAVINAYLKRQGLANEAR